MKDNWEKFLISDNGMDPDVEIGIRRFSLNADITVDADAHLY
jgi:hypothetical protein